MSTQDLEGFLNVVRDTGQIWSQDHKAIFPAGMKEVDKEWTARIHPFMYISSSFLKGDGAQLATVPTSSFRYWEVILHSACPLLQALSTCA